LLTESLLLGLAGGIGGLFLAQAGVGLLARLVPGPYAATLHQPDWRVFVFAFLLAVAVSLFFGVAPAWHASRCDVQSSLRTAGRGMAVGGSTRLRSLLVVAQVGLAVLLVTGAGLFLRSLQKLLSEQLGFRTDHVLALNLTIPGAETQIGRTPSRFVRLSEAIEQLPGVRAAGLVNSMPLTGANSNANIQPEGFQPPAPNQWPAADYRATTPGYFPTVGLPLLRGRLFDRRDGEMPPLDLKDLLGWFRSADLVCVVNQAMADRFWPGQDPIGKRFRFGPPALQGPWVRIVGIVGNTRQKGLHRAPEPIFYLSAAKYPWPEQTLLVRTSGDPRALAGSIRRAILQADSDIVIAAPRTLEDVVSDSTADRRANLRLMTIFAAFALALAATGVYGVVSFVAATRGQEFGIRMALGAVPADVASMVLKQGAHLILAGLALGLAACLLLGRAISGLLYGVQSTDPLVYAVSAAILLTVGLAASLLPALRSTRVDPVSALRAD
jgi:predicted permease